MTSISQHSASGVRLFPSCTAGYIMDFDLHAHCETCLGPQHGGLALTPRATRPYCAALPMEEKQRQVDAFAALQEDDEDDSWARCNEDFLNVVPDVAGHHDEGRKSPDSAPSIVGSPPGFLLFPVEDLEDDGGKEARLAPIPITN